MRAIQLGELVRHKECHLKAKVLAGLSTGAGVKPQCF